MFKGFQNLFYHEKNKVLQQYPLKHPPNHVWASRPASGSGHQVQPPAEGELGTGSNAAAASIRHMNFVGIRKATYHILN
jgi:hypothetical protein